jgi:hypothetical protein
MAGLPHHPGLHRNKYSVYAKAPGRAVIHAHADSIIIKQNGEVVGEQTVYDSCTMCRCWRGSPAR